MPQAQPGQRLLDGVSTFGGGVDTSVPARSLQKNQLSRAENVSLRNEFATHRNCFKKVVIDYGGDVALQAKLKNVRWQKGVYYEADEGPEAMVTAIGGRLFRWDPGSETAPIGTLTARVSEITPRFQTQLTFGFTAPVVKGTVQLTVTSTEGFTVCTIIEIGTESMASISPPPPYWYPGVPLQSHALGTHHYHVISIESETEMTVENLDDIYGNLIPAGASVFGYDPNPNNRRAWLTQAEKWVVWQDGQSPAVFYDGVASRRSVGMKFITDPNSPKTRALTAFTSPDVGSTVVVNVGDAITFNVGAEITIGDGDYSVTVVGLDTSPQTLTLLNLNDASGTLYPIGTEVLWSLVKDASEIPPGRMMAYGKGRLVIAGTDGKTFLFSNLVGDSSGTQEENYRDAVLKIRDSNQLTGGRFRVPGTKGEISALIFIPQMDVSLGQGPLQVHTTRSVFNCNLPLNAVEWQLTRSAILTETDVSYGALSHESVIPVNGDIHYRSRRGIDSYVTRRRDFLAWGNSSISTEVNYYLDKDDEPLLEYASQIVFDKRRFTTCSPVESPYGVYHRGLVAMDLNPLGRVRDKKLADYEGLLEDAAAQGLKVFQVIVGGFRDVERAYMFALGPENEIELYEILQEGVHGYDNDSDRIKWAMEFATLFDDNDPAIRSLKRLANGELAVEEVSGVVTFAVYYRHDEYSNWTLWHTWAVCAEKCPPTSPCVPSDNYMPQHRSAMGIGEPSPRACDVINDRPAREGYYFHVRLEITGHCKLTGMPLGAITIPEEKFAPIICSTEAQCVAQLATCEEIKPPFSG